MRTNQVIAVFADVNNLYHGAHKRYCGRLDFKMFLEHLVQEHGRLQIAYAYGVADDEKVGSFRTLLRHIGFECRWGAAKYNWNVGIAMDVMRQLDKIDLVILGSGDPYLAPCAEYVRQQGIKCYSYGFRISEQMKKSVDRYFEISEEMLIKGAMNANTN